MHLKPNLDTALMLILSPLLLFQILLLGPKIIRLPEPKGPRCGTTGDGPALRLLVLGDSSAAGVGVDRQDQALAQQISENMGKSRQVTWNLCAKNGATSRDAKQLLTSVQGQKFDLAYVIFGVNDVKNLHSERAWRNDMTDLILRLRAQHGLDLIVLSGLPPMEDFPLLPRPLRTLLGMRAARFDRALREVASRENCEVIAVDSSLEIQDMAKDGFHPGPAIYKHWAQSAAGRFEDLIKAARPTSSTQ